MSADPHPSYSALVLAGSRSGEDDSVARSAGVPCKALAPVGGRAMAERVIETLLAHPRVGPVTISLAGDLPLAHAAPQLAQWIEAATVQRSTPAASPVDSVAQWMARQGSDRKVLVTTADHALLNERMLDQVLVGDAQADTAADVRVAMVPLALLTEKYPAQRRTRLHFRDGQFKACNLFVMRNRPPLHDALAFWQSLQTLRKAPLRMAWRIGPGALLRYALRRMTLDQAFDHLSKKTGARLQPVMLDVAEAAIDVDSPADLAFVNELLGSA